MLRRDRLATIVSNRWIIAFAVCPILMILLGVSNRRDRPYYEEPGWHGDQAALVDWPSPLPWASRALDGLLRAHQAVCLAAFVALLGAAPRRGLALVAIVLFLIAAGLVIGLACWFDASMATTGVYL